ncbi:MAG: endonuclease MutS2 [Oscillospiraceae bacterium]|nr:endonuclease MutS2 [Oscillospiraceae bacterium]
MNKYYRSLELHKILEMLSAEASNERTKEMALALEPSSDLEYVRLELKKTNDCLNLSAKFGTPSFYNFKDIRNSVSRAKSGASLSLKELLSVAQMLKQIRVLTEWNHQCIYEELENSIGYLFESLCPNKQLETRIYESILSEDEIADTASSELASIRRKIAQAGIKIRESLDKLVKSSEVQKSLQESIVTLRDGRFVLPVKAEHKGKIPGLVHSASATGSTLFIEPMSVVEANNDIRILEAREQEEIERIIAELSSECAYMAETLTSDYETCAEINLYFAKANLAAKMNGSIPEISDDGVIELKKARHPLIDKSRVVPVDISLGGEYKAIIITGPNTGGKTVALKTVGLLTAMAECGMLIPASDSRLSVFGHILVDIGDQQSIEESLSTFSSHIHEVVEILKLADDKSLILLDELGSGTDPVEGAALAVSLIEEMKRRGSDIMVTTHYQELKLYAVEQEGVQNASCEFDTETLRPTYRIIAGTPGKSNAFSISEKLGVPAEIINNARELVSTENARFEKVIENLENTRTELEAQKAEAERLRRENERTLAELNAEKEAFEASKESEFEKARVQAMRIVENCRMQSDILMDELNEIKKKKNSTEFSGMVSGAKSMSRSTIDKMYNEANPVHKKSNDTYKLPRPLKRGDHVLIVDIDKKGILAGDPDSSGNVFVQYGVMKTKVAVNRLRLVEEQPKSQPKPKGVSKQGVTSKIERRSSLELDIRGHAVDEGIHELDAFIDNAVLCNAGIVTIIHGKGTGVLRNGIRAHLKRHPSVKSFRPGVFGEGEDGVTVVELK